MKGAKTESFVQSITTRAALHKNIHVEVRNLVLQYGWIRMVTKGCPENHCNRDTRGPLLMLVRATVKACRYNIGSV